MNFITWGPKTYIKSFFLVLGGLIFVFLVSVVMEELWPGFHYIVESLLIALALALLIFFVLWIPNVRSFFIRFGSFTLEYLSRSNFLSKTSSLWPILSLRSVSRYQLFLAWVRMPSKRFIMFGIFIVTVSFLYSILNSFWTIAFLLFMGLAGLSFILMRDYRRLRLLFAQQLPDAFSVFADLMRAGYSISDAVAQLRTQVSFPLGAIFYSWHRGFCYGLSFSEVLERSRVWIQLSEWDMCLDTLLAQQDVGGNIIPVLSELSKTLRDKLSVDREVMALSAAGRFSALVVSLLAPISFLFFYLFSPSYISFFITTSAGQLLLLLAGLLEVVGFLAIRKVITISY